MNEMQVHGRTEIWLKGYVFLLDIVDTLYKAAVENDDEHEGLKWLASLFSYDELSEINGVLFTSELPIDLLTDSLKRNHIMSAMKFRNEYWWMYNLERGNEWLKNHDDFKDIRELVFALVKALNENDEAKIESLSE